VSDFPTVEEIFGTEGEEERLSTAEDEVLDQEQLAAQDANDPLMADKIAAIEGCIATAGAGRRPRGSPQSYASVELTDAPDIIKEISRLCLEMLFMPCSDHACQ
jgi:hypothetical protein